VKAIRTTLNLEHHKDFRYKNLDAMNSVALGRGLEYIGLVYEIDTELQTFIDECKVRFSPTRRSSVFKYNPLTGKKEVVIATRPDRIWRTYNRKTIGVCAKKITIPRLLRATLAVVHEFTHAIQLYRWLQNNKKGIRGGEVETTRNEIHYISIVSPSTILKMEKTQ